MKIEQNNSVLLSIVLASFFTENPTKTNKTPNHQRFLQNTGLCDYQIINIVNENFVWKKKRFVTEWDIIEEKTHNTETSRILSSCKCISISWKEWMRRWVKAIISARMGWKNMRFSYCAGSRRFTSPAQIARLKQHLRMTSAVSRKASPECDSALLSQMSGRWDVLTSRGAYLSPLTKSMK